MALLKASSSRCATFLVFSEIDRVSTAEKQLLHEHEPSNDNKI